MPNPAALRERRLRKTKAQLIDEIDTLEQRAAALEAANRSSAPMGAKASEGYLANQQLADLARFTSENPNPVLRVIRYNSLRQTVDADVNVDIGPGFGFQTRLGGTEDWFEPVVGVRGVAEISDRWTIGARADFGGFGVNGDDLQWKVIAGFDYRAWERTSVKFGWQFYGIDYSTNRSDGKFAYDVFQIGAYLALTHRF